MWGKEHKQGHPSFEAIMDIKDFPKGKMLA